MVGMGAMVSRFQLGWLDAINTSQLLYLLIVLVGIDLTELKLGSAWRTRGDDAPRSGNHRLPDWRHGGGSIDW
jgi:hypothetical protein